MKLAEALTFVNHKYFRSAPKNWQDYDKAFFYHSKKPRVIDLVGGGR